MNHYEAINLSLIDIEKNLAETSEAMQATSEAMEALSRKQDQVLDVVAEFSDKLDRLEGLMQNFVRETQLLRSSSQQLQSDVRAKIKVAGG